MRYTEYHGDIAVIKDKSQHKEAMERLAQFEDCAGMQGKICDKYCVNRSIAGGRIDILDEFCSHCELETLLRLLEEVEQ